LKLEEKKDSINKYEFILNNHIQLGHANPRMTYNFMKGLYFWSTMREDVTNTLKSCKQCSLFNEKRKDKSNYPLLIGEAFEK
jgi:hypothetical protein